MFNSQEMEMPPEKKLKLQVKENDELKELILFRNEIKKISNLDESTETIDCNQSGKIKRENESDPLIEDESDDYENENLKKFIRVQIRNSERRIHQRIDTIERKINRLLENKVENENISNSNFMDDDVQEEHLIEYVSNESEEQQGSGEGIDEFQIFPISDEDTFDWFMLRLKDEEYRSALVNRRWQLTRNVGTRSFNVSVKDFIRMHFDLAICIKYSVSGYGSRGSKKKKLDSQILAKYIHDCFNRTQPGINSIQDVSKAITQFWGRSQDTYSKTTERIVKKENHHDADAINYSFDK